MKKLISLLLALVVAISMAACGGESYTIRVGEGIYYTDGIVITSDGNAWEYQTDTIDGEPSRDGQNVLVFFDTNGTLYEIEDDSIRSLKSAK